MRPSIHSHIKHIVQYTIQATMQIHALSAKQVSKEAPRLTCQQSSLQPNQDYDNNATRNPHPFETLLRAKPINRKLKHLRVWGGTGGRVESQAPRIDVDCNVLYVDTIQSSSIHGAYVWLVPRVGCFIFFPPTHPLNNSERDIQHIGIIFTFKRNLLFSESL